MKKKIYYLGALALPFLLAACADDMLTTEGNQAGTVANGKVLNLGNDFRIFASRDAGNNVNTRGEWISNVGTSFYWMPEGVVTADNTTTVGDADLSKLDFAIDDLVPAGLSGDSYDKVGLCWVGDGEPADNIYTNYEFVHDGWLEKDAGAMENNAVECIDGVYKYNWNFVRIVDAKTKNATLTVSKPTGNRVLGTLSAAVDAYDLGMSNATNKKTITDLDLGRGTFKTENKSIFSGNYIAYYPYNKGMVEADKLQATSAAVMDYEVGESNRLLTAGRYTFATGYMDTPIEGGSNASSLKMKQVSGLISLKLPVGQVESKTIQHMFLLNSADKFRTSMKLTASGIKQATAAADADAAFKTAASNIVSEQVIRLDFKKAGVTADLEKFTFNNNENPSVIIPLLPTDNTGYIDVVLVNDKGAAVMTTIADMTVKSGAAQAFDLSNSSLYTWATGKEGITYVAWDQTSLTTAMTNATQPTDKILLLGDVVISSAAYNVENKNITGEWRGAKIGKLIVAGSDNTTATVLTVKTSTLACDIDIEAKGCCHNTLGKLVAIDMSYLKGTAPVANTITNNGEIEFSNNASVKVENNKIYGDIVNQPLRYVGNGQKDVLGKEYLIDFETVPAKISITEKATVNVLGTIKNNTATDKAGSKRVDGLISLVKMTGATDGDDARLLITIDGGIKGSLINDATIENRGTIANNTGVTGNIENKELATFVNMIGGQLNGYMMTKASNSNFISEVDNSIDTRFATALADGLTNIIKIVTKNTSYTEAYAMHFPMQMVGTRTNLKFIVDAAAVVFIGKRNTTVDAEHVYTIVPATIGALEVTAQAIDFQVNTIDKVADVTKGGNIDPVSLTINNTAYNTTHHTVSGKFVNGLYPVAIPAAKVLASGVMTVASSADAAADKVVMDVTGDIEVLGTVNFGKNATNTPKLVAHNDVNVNGAGKLTFDEKVIESKILGNLTAASGTTTTFKADVKIKVGEGPDATDGKITNNGIFNIASQTSTKSPAVVFCKEYNLTGGTWTNGRPTPFTAGGVTPDQYNW